MLELENAQKQFWKNIKGTTNHRNVTYKIKPQEWLQYFQQLLCSQTTEENGNDKMLADIIQNNDASELNTVITDEEVKQNISHLHSYKSPGPDGLPAELFKCTIGLITPYLTVFNTKMATGDTPAAWGKRIICPLLKKIQSWIQTTLEACC